MYGGKKKKKVVKMKGKECSSCGETQHNVPKRVEESKKIKPKEVFGSNYKSQSKIAKTKGSRK